MLSARRGFGNTSTCCYYSKSFKLPIGPFTLAKFVDDYLCTRRNTKVSASSALTTWTLSVAHRALEPTACLSSGNRFLPSFAVILAKRQDTPLVPSESMTASASRSCCAVHPRRQARKPNSGLLRLASGLGDLRGLGESMTMIVKAKIPRTQKWRECPRNRRVGLTNLAKDVFDDRSFDRY